MSKHDGEKNAGDNRRTRSLAGLAAILLLAVIALYLIDRLRVVSELQDCVMSGRTNCAPIDTH